MSKIEEAENILYTELEHCFEKLDIQVGKIYRYTKANDEFYTGTPATKIVQVINSIGEELSQNLLEKYRKRRKPSFGLFGSEKFEQQFQNILSDVLHKYFEYGKEAVKDFSSLSVQPHLYARELEGLLDLQEKLEIDLLKEVSNED